MRFLVVIAIFIASAFAAPHPRVDPCSAPTQWEADTLDYDVVSKYYASGRTVYDAVGKRVRTMDRVDENNTRAVYDHLYLYEKRVYYRTDVKTRECTKRPLTHPFVPAEVRPNSTYVGEVTIGEVDQSGAGVLIQLWQRTTEDGVGLQSFTVDGCIPIETQFIGNHHGLDVNYHSLYYNVKPGINNPEEAFAVPKECPA